MEYPRYVSDIIERLEKTSFEAYIVGGSVRDTIMGRIPNDYDVATSALPEQTLEIFEDMKTIPTGLKHGTVTVLSEGHPIEVTTFRVDGEYADSRRPTEVSFTDSITTDLSRRDFTVNAMAYSKKRGLIDPFGGKNDIENKIIRAVGEPQKRFEEDALRIMRAFRFSAQLGFDIDKETLRAAYDIRDNLSHIARERISQEFIKLITSAVPAPALKAMRVNMILPHIFGDTAPSDAMFEVIAKVPASERVRIGILLCEFDDKTKRDILRGLRLSNKLTSNILNISAKCSQKLSGAEVDARRFIGSCGELCEDVISAAKALGTITEDFESLIKKNLSEKSCTAPSDLAVNGSDLVAIGIRGKAVGNTLGALLERVLEEPSLNEREILLRIAAKLNNI